MGTSTGQTGTSGDNNIILHNLLIFIIVWTEKGQVLICPVLSLSCPVVCPVVILLIINYIYNNIQIKGQNITCVNKIKKL
jgi:hypothetical protein